MVQTLTAPGDSVATVPDPSPESMNEPSQKSAWRRYRMPIILGILAFAFYALSIVWIIFGRGQIA